MFGHLWDVLVAANAAGTLGPVLRAMLAATFGLPVVGA